METLASIGIIGIAAVALAKGAAVIGAGADDAACGSIPLGYTCELLK